MAVPAEEFAMPGEERLRLVAEGEQRLLRAQARAGLGQRHDLVRLHRVSTCLARVTAKGAVAAVVAAERGQRHEDLRRESGRAAAAPVAQLAGLEQELRECRRRRVDERARVLMRDHARRFAVFFFEASFEALRDDAADRESFGRTSLAKRSML